jgi:hypothetical protein
MHCATASREGCEPRASCPAASQLPLPAHRPAEILNDGGGEAKGGRRAGVAGCGDDPHRGGLLRLGHVAGDDGVHGWEGHALAQTHGNAAEEAVTWAWAGQR